MHRITLELSPFVLQIISQKDEHCWVGELNGLRGKLLLKYKGMKDFQFFLCVCVCVWEIPPVIGICWEPVGVNEGFLMVIGIRCIWILLKLSQEAVITYS